MAISTMQGPGVCSRLQRNTFSTPVIRGWLRPRSRGVQVYVSADILSVYLRGKPARLPRWRDTELHVDCVNTGQGGACIVLAIPWGLMLRGSGKQQRIWRSCSTSGMSSLLVSWSGQNVSVDKDRIWVSNHLETHQRLSITRDHAFTARSLKSQNGSWRIVVFVRIIYWCTVYP